MSVLIEQVSATLVNAAEFTNWVFVEIETDAGFTGTGYLPYPPGE